MFKDRLHESVTCDFLKCHKPPFFFFSFFFPPKELHNHSRIVYENKLAQFSRIQYHGGVFSGMCESDRK